eukprot:14195863-Alexandrium_andersonii.AAC.1
MCAFRFADPWLATLDARLCAHRYRHCYCPLRGRLERARAALSVWRPASATILGRIMMPETAQRR